MPTYGEKVHEDKDEVLRFVKLTPNAFAPSKASQDAAGFDLYRLLEK
jgi:hypothetical protein